MEFEPHLKLTWSGTLSSGEMWANSVSLVPDTEAWAAAANAVAKLAIVSNLLTSVNLTDDLVADVSAFHARPASAIHPGCILKRVKLAAIDASGHYASSPIEAAVTVPGQGNGNAFPHQVARKVTLITTADLGRVKGGWYMPGVTDNAWDWNTNLLSVFGTEAVRGSVETFLENLEDAPGLDANSFRVVVASQGRHNSDGSVRLGPANHDVVGVNIGRRVDVQRRRANKISEARIANATI